MGQEERVRPAERRRRCASVVEEPLKKAADGSQSPISRWATTAASMPADLRQRPGDELLRDARRGRRR